MLRWLCPLPPAGISFLIVQNIIKRQRQAIEKIRKENERLKEQLKAESQQNAAATEGNTVSVIAGEGKITPKCGRAAAKRTAPKLPRAIRVGPMDT